MAGNKTASTLTGSGLNGGFDTDGAVEADTYIQTPLFKTTGIYSGSQPSPPTIASNACGTTTQGVVTSGSTDEAGTVTVGTLLAGVTACQITFGQTHATAPASCICEDESSVIALSPSRSTTTVTCTSAVTLASAVIDYICRWTTP